MKPGLLVVVGMGLGAAFMGAGLIIARGSERPCLSMITVSELVEACMEGDREVCALMDRTVPASCLMERAVEATEAKRMRFNAGRPEEITL